MSEQEAKVSQIGLYYTDPKKAILGAIKDRDWTDRHVSYLWVLAGVLVVVPTFVNILFGITSLLTGSLFEFDRSNAPYMAFVYGRYFVLIVFAYLIGSLAASLISRLNDHFEREEKLRTGILGYLKARKPVDEKADIKSNLETLSSIEAQSLAFEKHHDARNVGLAVTAVFSAYGFLGVLAQVLRDLDHDHSARLLSGVATLAYLVGLGTLLALAYYLMRAALKHDQRWRGFADSTASALRKLGVSFAAPKAAHSMPERSVTAYAVLTLATMGLFGLFWLYVIIRDPNVHFENQWLFEDALAAAVEP